MQDRRARLKELDKMYAELISNWSDYPVGKDAQELAVLASRYQFETLVLEQELESALKGGSI
jgi:hypothetical protein